MSDSEDAGLGSKNKKRLFFRFFILGGQKIPGGVFDDFFRMAILRKFLLSEKVNLFYGGLFRFRDSKKRKSGQAERCCWHRVGELSSL